MKLFIDTASVVVLMSIARHHLHLISAAAAAQKALVAKLAARSRRHLYIAMSASLIHHKRRDGERELPARAQIDSAASSQNGKA